MNTPNQATAPSLASYTSNPRGLNLAALCRQAGLETLNPERAGLLVQASAEITDLVAEIRQKQTEHSALLAVAEAARLAETVLNMAVANSKTYDGKPLEIAMADCAVELEQAFASLATVREGGGL